MPTTETIDYTKSQFVRLDVGDGCHETTETSILRVRHPAGHDFAFAWNTARATIIGEPGWDGHQTYDIIKLLETTGWKITDVEIVETVED